MIDDNHVGFAEALRGNTPQLISQTATAGVLDLEQKSDRTHNC